MPCQDCKPLIEYLEDFKKFETRIKDDLNIPAYLKPTPKIEKVRRFILEEIKKPTYPEGWLDTFPRKAYEEMD